MPKTTYRTSYRKAVIVDPDTIRKICKFIEENFDSLSKITVSFSDHTKNIYENAEEIFIHDNVESRRVVGFDIESDWDKYSYGEVEIEESYNNIRLNFSGEEEKILKSKRFMDEKILLMSQWYSAIFSIHPMIVGAIQGAMFPILIAPIVLQFLEPFKSLDAIYKACLLSSPLVLFFLYYVIFKLFKKAFPMTVFAIGKNYDNIKIARKILIGAVSSIFAILIGGLWYFVDRFF